MGPPMSDVRDVDEPESPVTTADDVDVPDPMDEAKRAEWLAHLDWHGHDIEVEVS
jgi:hypothetical protein